MKEKSRLIKVNNHTFMQELRRMFSEEKKESITFIVRGFSMRPFLEDGRDKVILGPPRTPVKGDVVLAEFMEKTYALHRVIAIDGDVYTMQGDGNSLKQTERFTRDDIVGVAIGFIRKGKHVSVESRKWRTYSTMWRILKPLRRILLAIYRRI